MTNFNGPNIVGTIPENGELELKQNQNDKLTPMKKSFKSAAIAVVAANRGKEIIRQRRFRSASIDSGIECQLRLLKNETFRKLAKKEISEKLIQSEKSILRRRIKWFIILAATAFACLYLNTAYSKMKSKIRRMTSNVPDDVKLGVVRLDYDYPPIPGDVDSPDSFSYDVIYRTVPGLTFEMSQAGRMTDKVQEEFIDAVRWLHAQNVSAITGDCGFMMYFQEIAIQYTSVPVFMSSLIQLPIITAAFKPKEKIAIFTANLTSLKPMEPLIQSMMPKYGQDERIVMVGAEDVDGFEAVALGELVDYKKVEPGIVELAKETLRKTPNLRAFLFECTELSAYSDAVRQATGLPVLTSLRVVTL